MFSEMQNYLAGQGVKKVLVACPGCYSMFAQYGDCLLTESIYEVLARDGLGTRRQAVAAVTIHDPCAVRFEEQVHKAVRKLVQKQGFEIEEMAHSGPRTLCCGDGGGAGLVAPGLADAWGALREKEVNGRKMVTYCAGCVNALSKRVPATHVLDMLFDSAAASGKERVARPPVTYWKRLKLKQWFKRNVPVKVTRERTLAVKKSRRETPR
jgi:Fe-S oxidoreductase